MKKEKRLRRRIEHDDTEVEIDDNNLSPCLCTDCNKKYPLIGGSSNIRCKTCNAIFKKKVGFHYVGFSGKR